MHTGGRQRRVFACSGFADLPRCGLVRRACGRAGLAMQREGLAVSVVVGTFLIGKTVCPDRCAIS